MKRFLSQFSVLFIVFVVFSCTNEESIQPEKSGIAIDLKKLTEEYNIKHLNISAKYFEDNVDFERSEEMIVLLIGKPGNYKTSFRVQILEDNLKEYRNIESAYFKVAYLGRDLILSNEEKTFYFTVDEKPNFPKIAADGEVTYAYGIANWSSEQLKTSSSKTIAYELIVKKASCTCEPVLGPEQSCNSGGSGSTSCSQGDCSVTCGGGHYACCNPGISEPEA